MSSSPETRHAARHEARIVAMQALYEADVANHEAGAVLERLLAAEGADYAPATVAYAHRLVAGVGANREEIDALITGAAPAWPLAQIAKIDKSILRVAIYEVLKERGGVPYRAAINEAVEVAKLYGSDSSSRFVNGVLGAVANRSLGKPEAGERAGSGPTEQR